MLPPRWIKSGKPAFGAGESDGEGVMLLFDTHETRLEATLFVPQTLNVGSQFINFYVGFNTTGEGGTPLVEAGVSLSHNRDYSASPPPTHLASHVTMHRANTFQNPANQQTGELFWNVFINNALDHTSSNMPASGDLRGQQLPIALEITGGKIFFRAGAMRCVPIPFAHKMPVGHAKLIAATDDATKSTFAAATMRMDKLGKRAVPAGRAFHVNGAGDQSTMDATTGANMFTCETKAS